MPRTLKRRSDAISRDDESPEPSPGPSHQNGSRRQRSSSAASATSAVAAFGADSDFEGDSQATTQNVNIQNLVKKLIRLALSSEYSRNPIRRQDIAQKIFKESNASPRLFKQVFNAAQKQLQDVFGMQLFELPSRDKTSLKDRRAQATQTSKSQSNSTSTKSWILISTLSAAYKTHPSIVEPALAPSREIESTYVALYTFILSLIYLNNSSLPEAKLERYLKRVNAETFTILGSLDKLLQRMIKEGYIEKRRDTSSGEEIVEYFPGPRGKVEVGIKGVAGLVRSVYGFGSVDANGQHRGISSGQSNNDDNNQNRNDNGDDNASYIKIDRDELEQKLKRTLGEGAADKRYMAESSSGNSRSNGGNTSNNGAMEVGPNDDDSDDG